MSEDPIKKREKELEYIEISYSKTGDLEKFKKRYPDSVLIEIFTKLQDRIGFSVDEILVMLLELNSNRIDFVKHD